MYISFQIFEDFSNIFLLLISILILLWLLNILLHHFSSLEFDSVCFYSVYFKFGKVYGIFW